MKGLGVTLVGLVRSLFLMREGKFKCSWCLCFISAFVAWSALFIWKASFIGPDGKRYFCLSDDAMISMRYAWNLSHGHGLVWNIGERVEGFTNILMTLIMAIFTFLFDKRLAVLAVQLLGILTVIVSALCSLKLLDELKRLEPDSSSGASGPLCLALCLAYYPFVYWTLMGVETGLIATLVIVGLWFALRFGRTRNGNDAVMAAVWFGLAYLARPDSAVLGIVALFFCVLRSSEDPWCSVRALLFYAVFILVPLLFRLSYYGDLVPNTYHLKLEGMAFRNRLENGLLFIQPFLSSHALIFTLAGVSLWRSERRSLVVFAMPLLMVCYQVLVGGDFAPGYWRMNSTVMPIVVVLAVLGAETIMKGVFGTLQKKTAVCAAVGIAALALLSANLSYLSEILFKVRPYGTVFNESQFRVSYALSELAKTNRFTVGIFAAGTVPYFTGFQAIDFLGKTDRYIASLRAEVPGPLQWGGMFSVPGHNKFDFDYSIKKLKPTYVQLNPWWPGIKFGKYDLNEWTKPEYVVVKYGGLRLALLRDSPDVAWNKLAASDLWGREAPVRPRRY